MTTLRKLLTGSLRLIRVVGANEDVTSEDIEISQKSLNGLLDNLQIDLLNIYHIRNTRFLLEPGKATYTLGPAVIRGRATDVDWAIERPVRVENAVLLQAAGISYPSPPTLPSTYFTSAIYPMLVEEGLAVTRFAPDRGLLFGAIIDDLSTAFSAVGGTLETTVSFITYTIPTEDLGTTFSPVGGELTETIRFITYTIPTEDLGTTLSPVGGELTVTINFLDYTMLTESMSTAFAPLSGELL